MLKNFTVKYIIDDDTQDLKISNNTELNVLLAFLTETIERQKPIK